VRMHLLRRECPLRGAWSSFLR